MKRKIALILLLVLVITGCQSGNNKENKLNIGILQYIEHPALDSVREGFEEELKDLGIDAKIDYQSAQGDIGVARTIAEKFSKDKVDLIFAIGTSAAQAAASVTEDIPVIFSAVTNPVDAELVESFEKPGTNVKGTTDKVVIEKQFNLFKEIDENIKTIGVVYSADEANSIAQISEIEEIGPKLGFKINAKSIQNISDLPQVGQSVVKDSDGVYIISDNKIASSISLLADLLIENMKPSVGAEEAHVEGGCLISDGISYNSLGKTSADMAKRILIDGEDPGNMKVESTEETIKKINMDTLKALDLDSNLEVFKDGEEI